MLLGFGAACLTSTSFHKCFMVTLALDGDNLFPWCNWKNVTIMWFWCHSSKDMSIFQLHESKGLISVWLVTIWIVLHSLLSSMMAIYLRNCVLFSFIRLGPHIFWDSYLLAFCQIVHPMSSHGSTHTPSWLCSNCGQTTCQHHYALLSSLPTPGGCLSLVKSTWF